MTSILPSRRDEYRLGQADDDNGSFQNGKSIHQKDQHQNTRSPSAFVCRIECTLRPRRVAGDRPIHPFIPTGCKSRCVQLEEEGETIDRWQLHHCNVISK